MASAERILTTHTGSLGRLPQIRDMVLARAADEPVDPDAFHAAARSAVAEIVDKQVKVGLDIVNDGEQSKPGFVQYVRQRLTGYEGSPVDRVISLEARDFPDAPGAMGMRTVQPCTGPVEWKDFSAVERDIANLQAAAAGHPENTFFMNAVSPGTLSNNNPNRYYPTRDEYLAAIATAMSREYRAITDAGFILQLDAPDLAQRSFNFPDLSVADWRVVVRENIDVLHHALEGIAPERVRVHVCWGAGEGPHNHDTELSEIIDLLMSLKVGAVSVVSANGRHSHEWQLWKEVELPAGLTLIPGVIDSTTNIIEHPEAVAERLVNFAQVLGPDRVIGGVDCGFATSATMAAVDPRVAWAKLGSLVEGARIASRRLFG
jgi:5-methyltetrahydropteroyltriglutamate--homocysteine methyltransferase